MVQCRIARWTLSLLFVAASGFLAPAAAQVRTIATLRIPNPEPGRPRKVVIVRGVELSGPVEMRYEHGCAWLNGVEWLSAPTPHGFMTPKATFNAEELSPAAVRTFHDVPRVVELKRQGLTTNRAIEIYFAQQESLLEYVSDVYRNALPRGKDAADRAARLAIDPGLASVDAAGPRAPAFSSSGSIDLYFLGFGTRGVIREGAAKEPTAGETAAWLWSRAEGQYQELGRMLELDAPVLALSTAGTISFYTGGDATRAFEELDRLHAARSAAARRAVADSLKVLPAIAASELEQAHAFAH